MLLTDKERWRLVQADCIEHMAEMPAAAFPDEYADRSDRTASVARDR